MCSVLQTQWEAVCSERNRLAVECHMQRERAARQQVELDYAASRLAAEKAFLEALHQCVTEQEKVCGRRRCGPARRSGPDGAEARAAGDVGPATPPRPVDTPPTRPSFAH